MGGPNLISKTRRAVAETPREVFNWYLFFCTIIISFSGVAKGFDEGEHSPSRRVARVWLTKC